MTGENKVFIKRVFACGVDELFEWLIKPELIIQWFGPPQLTIVSVANDPQIGGSYKIELQDAKGDPFGIVGEYHEINRPLRLVYSLEYETLASPKSKVVFELEPVGVRDTRLYFTQEFESIPLNMAHRTEAWKYMLQKLKERIL